MARRLPLLLLLAAAAPAAAILLAGCSKGGAEPAPAELGRLVDDNEQLRKQVDELSREVHRLRKQADDTTLEVAQLERSLAKAEEDLRSRLKEMVAMERGGGRGPVPVRAHVEPKFVEKPFMGFDAQDLLPDVAAHLKLAAKTGVLVTDVRPGSPAAVAGMAKNDVIQALDDHEIKDFKDLKEAFAGKKPGDEIVVTVMRGDKKLVLTVKLGTKKVRIG